jgi:trehalose utilization protein
MQPSGRAAQEAASMYRQPIRVTIWNEFIHERKNPKVREVYPDGIHRALADGLLQQLGDAIDIRTATLDEPDQGLSAARLEETDVLLWWGHLAHDQVADELVQTAQRRIWEGMGLIALHSAHLSKLFTRLMGTSCMLRWREAGERERIWIVNPSHPITEGLDSEYFELPATEMYGEFFDIPTPDELITISWFEGGEVFRSGCTFRRGKGRIFYWRPGHETFPIYYHPTVLRVLANGIRWAAPTGSRYFGQGREVPSPLSPLGNSARSVSQS